MISLISASLKFPFFHSLAPDLIRSSITFVLLATSRGVSPASFTSSGSAPAYIRCLMIWRFPCFTALCNGELASTDRCWLVNVHLVYLTPHSNSVFVSLPCPIKTDQPNGVHPAFDGWYGSEPKLMRYFTLFRSCMKIARWSGDIPREFRMLISASGVNMTSCRTLMSAYWVMMCSAVLSPAAVGIRVVASAPFFNKDITASQFEASHSRNKLSSAELKLN